MKKTVTIIFILTYIEANDLSIFVEEAFKENMVNMVKGVGGELLKQTRAITGNETDEEACNKVFGKYLLENMKISGSISTKNMALKNILNKHNINYTPIVEQKTNNISLDMQKLKREACNNNQFDTVKSRERNLLRLQIENDVLRELMRLNNLNDTSSNEYYRVKDEKDEEEEHKKAKAELKRQLAL